jgi:DNA-binding IclR family transcriptional regulator
MIYLNDVSTMAVSKEPARRAVRVSTEVHKRAKAYCAAHGLPMSEWADALLAMACEYPRPEAPPRPDVGRSTDFTLSLD